ncbi:MAG: hypothetical protein IH609_08805 [Dehalococcoidia bacterium]|nr:hypothetical protein [Dehalococcoidia bacterium]
MPRFYVSIPCGWLEAESPADAVRRTDHEGVTFLVREEGTDRLLVVVVGDDDEPTPVTQDVRDDWEYLFG